MLRLGGPLGVAAAAGVFCAGVWIGDPTTPGGPIPVCPTKALLGIDCPGCGSLRMLYSVMHGDVFAAVRFNAVGLIALVLLVLAFATWTYGRIIGRRMVGWQNYRWSAVLTMVVVSVWFVVRNLPFAPFTGLYV